MYIEFIKETQNENGKIMQPGTKGHFSNEAAREWIKQGDAKAIEDPEDYNPYPMEENESPEISTEKKRPTNVPYRPRKRPSKKA